MAKTVETDFIAYRDRGDARALARVFDALAPQLLLVAAHLLRDQAQAEDVVQETFLRAMAAAERYETSRPLLPWLVGILQNEVKKARRDMARHPDSEPLETLTRDLAPEVEAREFLAGLTEAVASLPETYRDVLNLRLIHGLDPREIAHSLGRSPSTVSTQMQRGLDLLRRALPTGFAGMLACSVSAATSGVGLVAVRSVVLERGKQLWPVSLKVASGALMMKKSFVALCLLLVMLPITYVVMDAWPSVDSVDVATSKVVTLPVFGAVQVSESVRGTRERVEFSSPRDDTWLITGRVLNHIDEPVSGAQVEARMHLGVLTEVDRAVADENGRYRIDFSSLRELGILERATGSLYLTASAAGYVPAEDGRVGSLPWMPEDSADIVLDLRLMPGSWLRGRVLNEDLLPVADASLWVWMGGPKRQDGSELATGERSWAKTDSAGRYEFKIVTEGYAALRVSSKREGLAVQDLGHLTINDDVEVVDIVLEPFEDLSGRLVLTDGSPLAGMSVVFKSQDFETDRLLDLSLEPLLSRGTTTDADGWFHVSGLAAGEYELSLRVEASKRPEYLICTWDPPREQVIPGQLLTVKLRDGEDRVLPGLTLTYGGWRVGEAPSLFDLQLAEQRGVSLKPSISPGTILVSSASASRRFILPLGSAWIFRGHLSGAKPIAEFWCVEDEVYHAELTLRYEIVTEAVGQLEFDVCDEVGNPVTDYSVAIETMLGAWVGAHDGSDDALLEVPSGNYQATLRSGVRQSVGRCNFPVIEPVEVLAGVVNKISLRIRRGGFIRVNLQPPPGDLIEEWQGVEVRTNHPKQERQSSRVIVELSENPRTAVYMSKPPVGKLYLCSTLFELGSHMFTIRADGYREVQVPAQVTAGEITDVEVLMQRK